MANRLIRIIDLSTGHVTRFAYDGFSRRIRETEIDPDGTTTTIHNLWCGQRLCTQRNQNGVVTVRYFSQGEIQNGTAYLYARNQVGSVVAMVNTQGEVKGRAQYGPYGKMVWQTGVQPGFAYAGLYLATYRAYDPITAHWLKRDPIGKAGGLNLYAYVMGNPVSLVDPYGLWSLQVNFYWGLGGSITFGYSDGRSFVMANAGFGVGAGASFNPNGHFPIPENRQNYCDEEAIGYLGVSGQVGVELLPINIGWAVVRQVWFSVPHKPGCKWASPRVEEA